jgi:hypothetical protein
MPPHNPGSLDDQVYTDIIVYVLAENDLLEGHEEFEADSEELLRFVIARDEPQEELEEEVERLREELHEPFEEEAVPTTVPPITPDEEPEAPEPEDPEEPEAEEPERGQPAPPDHQEGEGLGQQQEGR